MSTSLAALPYAIDVRAAQSLLGLSDCPSCTGLGEVSEGMRTFWQVASVVWRRASASQPAVESAF